MIPLSKYKLKTVLTWFLINTAIALLVFSFVSGKYQQNLSYVFWITMVRTHIISSITAYTGYSLGSLFLKKRISAAIPLTMAGAWCATIAAYVISNIILALLFKNLRGLPVTHGLYQMLFSILSLSTVVTVITTVIERLRLARAETEKDLGEIKQRLEDSRARKEAVFTVREDESHHLIKHRDIIYLSSHGKKTSFHTTGKDYETPQLLKEIEDRLPEENFIRIHKQFIINTGFLLKIKYYEGGRYIAFLSDGDETQLPVGRKFVPLLKERLGINI